MIDRDIFYARKSICERCQFWKNKCLKGHLMNSPVGCPENKFPAVQGASMMPNKPVAVATPTCDNCEKADGVRPLAWAQALAEFRQSMEAWLAAGRPLVSAQQHSARLTVCRKCPGGHFKHFQCKLCKCVVAIKAKLPTETCPANYWPRS